MLENDKVVESGHGHGDKYSSDVHVDVDRDLGLMPMVAEFLDEFLDPKGRMVYVVETGFVADEENAWDWWEDVPDKFQSSIVDMFGTEAAARACVRKAMTEKIRFHWNKKDLAHEKNAAWPWEYFYTGGAGGEGTKEDMESAIMSLRDGQKGAESNFNFPWSEGAGDGTQLFYASCGYLAGDEQDNDGVVSYDWEDCNQVWGYTFIIRALRVN